MAIKVKASAPVTPDNEIVEYPEGQGKWFVVEPDAVAPSRFAKTGPASAATSPEDTLINVMKKAAATKGKMQALAVERVNGLPPALDKDDKVPPALPDEKWTSWTFEKFHEDTRAAAKGLMSLGFPMYGTVNVWGFNAPEWNIAAFAGIYAGGKIGGIYPTDTPDTVAYKVVHSGGYVAVVEDRAKAEKMMKAVNDRGDAQHLKAIVTWGAAPAEGETLEVTGCGDVPFISWQKLLEKGKAEVTDAELEERVNGTKPQNCAVLVYTSGTTGDPKAVMLSHDNVCFASSNLCKMVVESTGLFKAGQTRIMSYLPLSHVAGCINDMCVTLWGTAHMGGYSTVKYARVYDIKKASIGQRISAIKPGAFFAVPLVYEKIADKIRTVAANVPKIMQTISAKGKEINLEYARNIQLGKSGAAPGCQCFGNKIANKVKNTVGFQETKFFVTGAAPIRVDTLEFYGSLGMHINEAYGMSETTTLASASTDQAHIWGSCGFELPGCQTKIFRVDPNDMNKKEECPKANNMEDTDEKKQGEICFRGRHVMMGYLANPDFGEAHHAKMEEKTAETIDADGWLHSGDKGLKTVLGMIKITGRYKELIIGAGGENIAPVPIEDNVKKLVPAINEVMMVGNQRKYNVAIITLKAVGANGELPGTDELDPLGKRVNPQVTSITQARSDKTWQKVIEDAINATNNEQKICLNNTFKIQKYTVLPTNFSEEGGELTPTKKLKRAVVEKAYNEIIEKMYATDGVYIPYE